MKTSLHSISIVRTSQWKAIIIFRNFLLIILCLLAYGSARAQLSGNYTIDPAKSASSTNYKSFHSAIADLDSGKRYDGGTANGKGVSGPVVFKVADGTYQERNTITTISGSSPTNQVTFTSYSKDSSKVVLNYDYISTPTSKDYTLKISGASNINIDYITISATSSIIFSGGTVANVVLLEHSVSNLTISSCLIKAQKDFYFCGIYSFQDQDETDSNKHFYHNYFQNTVFGSIQLFTNGHNKSKSIDKNTVLDGNVSFNEGWFFKANFQDRISLTNNITNANQYSIFLSKSTNTLKISNNRLINVVIDSCINTASQPAAFANNIISTFADIGSWISASTYFNVYHNSIYLTANSLFYPVAALGISNARHINLLNNTIEVSGLGRPFRCLLIDSLNNVDQCDYNNYFVDNSLNGSKYYDSIAAVQGTTLKDFAAWQLFTGMDKHSTNLDPQYDLSNFLATGNKSLAGKGLPLSSVTNDIAGKLRSAFGPTIGAYEITCFEGTYTIDPAKSASAVNYKDFHSAIADLDSGKRYDGGTPNGKGICGPVVFEVADGTYKEINTIMPITGSSFDNTVTFKSASVDSSKVVVEASFSDTGANVEHMFLLNNVSNIRFTSMTFSVPSSANKFIINNIFTIIDDGNFTLSNCALRTNSTNMVSGLGWIRYTLPASPDSARIITNNVFSGLYEAITLVDGGEKYLVVQNNIADSIGLCFLEARQSKITNCLIDNNTIFGKHGDNGTLGVFIESSKVTITRNRFNTTTGMQLDTGAFGTIKDHSLIADNVLNCEWNGIVVDGSFLDFYNNSIYVNFNNGYPIGLYLRDFTTNINIINNTIEAQTSDTSIIPQAINIFNNSSVSNCDHNSYYCTKKGVPYQIGFFGGKHIADLKTWQTATGGLDKHSLNIDPEYDFSNYLKTGNLTLAGKGASVSKVSSDILGNPRSASAPSIGAYELVSPLHYNDTTICKGSCAIFTSPLIGKKYKWSTGDTTKSIKFCTSKDDTLTLSVITNTDSFSANFRVYVTKTSCVWPGDANSDGKASIYDILPIGLAYSDTGSKRPGANSSWTGQACNDWKKVFKSAVNHKHADCNGDGLVDTADLRPLVINYGKTHLKGTSPASGSPTDPPLALMFSKDSAMAGDTVEAVINLGSSTIQAKDLYGLTLSISYNNNIQKARYFASDFSKSWLGTINKNMISLVMNDAANGVLDIGLTRTDQANASGYGQVGALSIVMPDNLGGKIELRQYINFTIIDYKAISASENEVPLNPNGDSILVYSFKNGLDSKTFYTPKLQIYPSPAHDHLSILAENEQITGVEIISILGEMVYAAQPLNATSLEIPVQNLAKGMYIINVKTIKGEVRARFMKD